MITGSCRSSSMDTGAHKDSLMNTGACRSSSMDTSARKDSLMITGACQSLFTLNSTLFCDTVTFFSTFCCFTSFITFSMDSFLLLGFLSSFC